MTKDFSQWTSSWRLAMDSVDGDLYMPDQVSAELDHLRDGMSPRDVGSAETVFEMMAKTIIIDSREAFARQTGRA
jgi:hypothetical protein